MSREISWLVLVVNHRFGHNVADEVLRQRLVVGMRIAHEEPPIQALPPALPENSSDFLLSPGAIFCRRHLVAAWHRRSDRDTPHDCGDVQTRSPRRVSAVLASMLSKVREAASREA
jgi:hypothetical protein